MNTRLVRDDVSTFRIRRSIGKGLGLAPDIDPLVKGQLGELDALLGKAVFPRESFVVPAARPQGGNRRGGRARGDGRALSPAALVVKRVLEQPLSPRYTPDRGGRGWAENSVAHLFATHDEAAGNFGIGDFIDRTPAVAQLKYAFLDAIQEGWSDLPADARLVLQGYPRLTDYLLASAYLVLEVEDEDALRNLIVSHRSGIPRIVVYAMVGAARALIDERQLKVDHYNDDDSAFVKRLVAAGVPLAASAFRKSVLSLVDEFIFDRDEEAIIDGAGIGEIPDGIKPLLVRYMRSSPVPITAANAAHFLPNFILQIMRTKGYTQAPEQDDDLPAGDFRVRFEDTEDEAFEVSTVAIESAAQIYHAMVLGEDLDVFGAVQYLTHRRLLMHGGLRIRSRTLRKDLQDYVFNNEFVDLATGARMIRTRAAERQMFAAQVFDQGSPQLPEDMATNGEFRALWKVLMLETARYLDRAQSSMHPESFVSAQNIAQAVEDLQYNLSTCCTGMATVIAPIVDAELDFVLKRILKHQEILQQIVPEGGTWKRAVDKLNAERRHQPGNAATLYNKARQGKEIIEAIAAYVPGDFDDLGKLSAFVGLVDGFITTQSILDKRRRGTRTDAPAATSGTREAGEKPVPAEPAEGEGEPVAAGDEWDF